jgi:hypothetical protein
MNPHSENVQMRSTSRRMRVVLWSFAALFFVVGVIPVLVGVFVMKRQADAAKLQQEQTRIILKHYEAPLPVPPPSMQLLPNLPAGRPYYYAA